MGRGRSEKQKQKLLYMAQLLYERTDEDHPVTTQEVIDYLEADGIRVDKDAHEVTVDGKPVDLSNKEFELLTYFMENKGIALSREKILNNVWNYDYFGDARTIDTHVKKLRSKLGPKGDNIKTIWGMGYKLEVDA